MSKYAMLSLDLNDDTDTEKRTKFDDELERIGWSKEPNLTTVWTGGFKDNNTDKEAITATISHVKAAATKASISSWDAIVHIGHSEPTTFSSEDS